MRDIQYEKTATWVFDEDIFKEWESWGSLLWIYGKSRFLYSEFHRSLKTPAFVVGSGKSILWFGILL